MELVSHIMKILIKNIDLFYNIAYNMYVNKV